MPALASRQSGNFTDAATWAVIDPVSLSDSEAGINASPTALTNSSPFTPGAITIDGIGIKIQNRVIGSTGTVTVRLVTGGGGAGTTTGTAVPGTTVTINVADLPTASQGNSISGFILFELPAPVTLLAATAYNVQIATSVVGTLVIWRNATVSNWSRFLRTTTTAAPAATDPLYITGEYISPGVNVTNTVTMNNNSAVIFGKLEVSGKGVLEYPTTPATNTRLRCNGNILVNGDARFSIGLSTNRIPSSSTAILECNQGGATVANGIAPRGNGILESWGAQKINKAFLNATVAGGATSLTSDVVTGWLAGDDIVVASTSRTAAENELRTLAVNSVGTTITVPALTFAHSGVGDTRGELANLTRNVKIVGESATVYTYMQAQADAIFNLNDTELQFMGSNTTNRRGIDVFTTTASSGSMTLRGCSLRNFEATGSIGVLANIATNSNITIDDCIFFRATTGISTAIITVSGNSITNNWGFSGTLPFSINMQAGLISNCRAIGSTGNGFNFTVANNLGLVVSNLIAHSCAAAGIVLNCVSDTNDYVTMSDLTSWRNAVRGLQIASRRLSINGMFVFGSGSLGIEITGSSLVDISNASIQGGLTQVQPHGIWLSTGNTGITINNTNIGNITPHTIASINVNTANSFHNVELNNCLLGDTTEISSLINFLPSGFIGSSRHDNLTNTHRSWRRYGNINSDSLFTVTAPLSARLLPSSLVERLVTREKRVAVPAGKSVSIGVFVRRSVVGDGTAYNGALPRLVLVRNSASGILTDTVIATASAASLGSFEFISGTTPIANSDTVYSFYIDCTGTTGWVNVDQWRVQIIDGSALANNLNGEDFWADGRSAPGLNPLIFVNSGTETYWSGGRPAKDLFPVSNAFTGKFFKLFE